MLCSKTPEQQIKGFSLQNRYIQVLAGTVQPARRKGEAETEFPKEQQALESGIIQPSTLDRQNLRSLDASIQQQQVHQFTERIYVCNCR
jgi:hypothetical protein